MAPLPGQLESDELMCMMLYLATRDDLPLQSAAELSIEEIEPSCIAVRQHFSLPVVRFVGAHTGCSCGFPHVLAEEPITYFDGMFGDPERRGADLKSVAALLALLRDHLAAASTVEMYPVWGGEEASPPKGVIEVGLDSLTVETFFFNEQFFYRVTATAE